MKQLFIFTLLCISTFLSAQKTFIAELHKSGTDQNILIDYHAYSNFSINELAISQFITDQNGSANFSLFFNENLNFDIYLFERKVTAPNYSLRTNGRDGNLQPSLNQNMAKTYYGYLPNKLHSEVALTIADGFLYGFINDGEETYFIQSEGDYIKDSKNYILYNVKDAKDPEHASCGVTGSHHLKKDTDSNANQSEFLVCKKVPYAIANDYSMFTKYGSVANVENRNIGIVNNVNVNYTGSFNDDLELEIVEQVVISTAGGDPWTSSTDSGELLDDFTAWGPTGFSATHADGSLWSDRDFDGGTIGLAWVGSVCTANRYNVLEDFNSNAQLIRVLTAHEIGHNFDALHDAAGSSFIMAPSVANVTQWSSASINAINSYVASVSCLPTCGPPVADFEVNESNICPGQEVQFTDLSSGVPTGWSWSFPGGSPSSSSDQNPSVTYNTVGTYNVTLTSSNSDGNDSETKNGYIVVSTSGTQILLSEDFENGAPDWTVDNPDGATTWILTTSGTGNGGAVKAAMDNYNYNAAGQIDWLISPVVDLSNASDALLEIEHAYARYNASFADQLEIRISTDGGSTFPTTLFTGNEDGSGNFATAPDNTSLFLPANASDWCFDSSNNNCASIDLSSYAGQSNVVIGIVNITGYGNTMFVDNVSITASCATSGSCVSNPVNTWIGSANGIWGQSAGNWSRGVVPEKCDAVVIPAGKNVVIQSGDFAECYTLQIDVNANFDVESGGILEVQNP